MSVKVVFNRENRSRWLPHLLICSGIYLLVRTDQFSLWVDGLSDLFRTYPPQGGFRVDAQLVHDQIRVLGFCMFGYGALLLITDAIKSTKSA